MLWTARGSIVGAMSRKYGRSSMSDPDFDTFPLVTKGNCFEDFTQGQVLTHHWGRTITEADNALFSTAMCNWNPMHLNAEFAKAHGHADVVVNPMLLLCTVVGLSVQGSQRGGWAFSRYGKCDVPSTGVPGGHNHGLLDCGRHA